MTRQDLKQVRHIRNEITMLENKLLELQEQRDHITAPTDGDGIRAIGTNSDRVGQLATEIAYTQEQIRERIADLYMKQNEVLRYVNTIEDTVVRQIITYRCCDLLSWQEIADKIGGRNTADSVRMIFKRFTD